MAPHSSTLAWKLPRMEEPSRLQSMASLSRTWRSNFTFTFHFHALEKEMATHSSVLAWRIPWTEEPGGLPSMGSHRVGHDWHDLAAASHHQPEEFGKGRKETPSARPLPRIPLASMHLGWAMRAPPGKTLNQNDWPKTTRKLIPSP